MNAEFSLTDRVMIGNLVAKSLNLDVEVLKCNVDLSARASDEC